MPTRRTPANRNHAVLRLLKQTVRTDWRAHSHAADTQCWGQEHNPPSHALHVEDKRRVLGLGTIKTHKPPLRREGGAKLEREGKNDPRLLADHRGSSRVNTGTCSTANMHGCSDMCSKSSKNNRQHEHAAGDANARRTARHMACFLHGPMCNKASSTSRDLLNSVLVL